MLAPSSTRLCHGDPFAQLVLLQHPQCCQLLCEGRGEAPVLSSGLGSGEFYAPGLCQACQEQGSAQMLPVHPLQDGQHSACASWSTKMEWFIPEVCCGRMSLLSKNSSAGRMEGDAVAALGCDFLLVLCCGSLSFHPLPPVPSARVLAVLRGLESCTQLQGRWI